MVNLNALVPWRNNKSEVQMRREDLFDPFLTFRREVDRMFDRFFDGFPTRTADDWHAITPAVDINETEKGMVVTAELPGVTDKDVEVSLVGDILTIKGEKKEEKTHKDGESTHVERRYGSFSRSVRLPFEPKDERVEAKFKDGVLTVYLPKPPELQQSVRRIEVKAH